MEQLITLRILLPYEIFAEVKDVSGMTVETTLGSYGFLPNRLDCAAALVPGILSYESQTEGEVYIAIDEGVLVKTGKNVSVSVRNAIGGTDLGELHKAVERQFLNLDERERNIRSVLAKLESSFIKQLTQFRKE